MATWSTLRGLFSHLKNIMAANLKNWVFTWNAVGHFSPHLMSTCPGDKPALAGEVCMGDIE